MRVALVLLAAALAALAAVLVYTRAADEPAVPTARATATPSYEQRARLAERITRDRDALSRAGVHLVDVTLADSCAAVRLVNPTAPNVAYVERRFSGACVQREPGAGDKRCPEAARGLTRDGRVTVPNVLDLGLAQAARRVLAADLTYTAECLGRGTTEPWAPSGEPDALVRVVAQCPRPGEQVRPGTEIALEATATLPGGFTHRVGALDRAATGTKSPCGDGRNPRG